MKIIFTQTIKLHTYYVIECMSYNLRILYIICTLNLIQGVPEVLKDSLCQQ